MQLKQHVHKIKHRYNNNLIIRSHMICTHTQYTVQNQNYECKAHLLYNCPNTLIDMESKQDIIRGKTKLQFHTCITYFKSCKTYRHSKWANHSPKDKFFTPVQIMSRYTSSLHMHLLFYLTVKLYYTQTHKLLQHKTKHKILLLFFDSLILTPSKLGPLRGVLLARFRAVPHH